MALPGCDTEDLESTSVDAVQALLRAAGCAGGICRALAAGEASPAADATSR